MAGNQKVWVGIDPGQTGAIAVVGEGVLEIHDWPGDERAAVDLCRRIHLDYLVYGAALEAQSARPGQGVSSTFKLGVNYGIWLAICAAFGWPTTAVRPSDWKRGLGYPAKEKALSKQHSLTIARRAYPEASDLLSRVKDHNRAEALLLARHVKNTGVV